MIKSIRQQMTDAENNIMRQIMNVTLSRSASADLMQSAHEYRALMERTGYEVTSEEIGDALDDIMNIPQLSDFKEDVLNILYYTEKYRY